jgi:hypothetical protein
VHVGKRSWSPALRGAAGHMLLLVWGGAELRLGPCHHLHDIVWTASATFRCHTDWLQAECFSAWLPLHVVQFVSACTKEQCKKKCPASGVLQVVFQHHCCHGFGVASVCCCGYCSSGTANKELPLISLALSAMLLQGCVSALPGPVHGTAW